VRCVATWCARACSNGTPPFLMYHRRNDHSATRWTRSRSEPSEQADTDPGRALRRPAIERGAGGPHARDRDDKPERRLSTLRSGFAERMGPPLLAFRDSAGQGAGSARVSPGADIRTCPGGHPLWTPGRSARPRPSIDHSVGRAATCIH
jgi:hypothetical protein